MVAHDLYFLRSFKGQLAAYEFFELYYPEEFRVWEKSSCDGLTFDVDSFLDSPAFSTAEYKIGDERVLVVEPL